MTKYMPVQTPKNLKSFLASAVALGGVGLVVVESDKDVQIAFEEARAELFSGNYQECADYLEIMDTLAGGKDKIFYLERGEKLNGLVLEIITEFEAGMVSLADRQHNTGLKTVQWNPAKTSFVVVISRQQVEASYPRLFEYISFVQSI